MAAEAGWPISGPDGQGGPHVFVEDLDRLELSGTDEHHLTRVLRLRAGDPLTASDGGGRWRACRYGQPLEPAGETQFVAQVGSPITIAFTPVKGDRPEWVVQKLTELGVDTIVVLRSARSVVRWEGERGARQMERLTRIAREAAMQSRRCYLPELRGIWSVAALAGGPGVVRADRGGPPLSTQVDTVLIGPEGGWTEAERDAVPTQVGLGPFVLRAETAAVAAAAHLSFLRSEKLTFPDR